jgi:alkanesulfonate monooxygenase SsuD/methylene tetrahydromethanopterin reductase-like flavin-dependent oxidoreductase (luciferase family)
MAQEFLSDSTGSDCPNPEPAEPERERVRMLIIGSPDGIREKIHTLYALGFAEVDAWSPLQIEPKSGEMMSILTQYRKRRPTDRKSGR